MADDSVQASSLQKKEQSGRRVITLVLMGAVGLAAFYYWGLIVPFVLVAVQDTVQLILLCIAIALLLYVCMDKQMRTLAVYAYGSLTRFVTGKFIELDPIGILNTYIQRMQSRLEEMDKSLGNLRGQRDKLKSLIDKNEGERVHQLKLAQQAQKAGAQMKNEFTLRGRQAGRLEKSNLSLKGLYERMDVLYKSMMRYRDASAVLVEDMKSEVEVKTSERNALMAGYNAFTKARQIMAGGGAERNLYDMTTEKLADDYANKMGEIEGFMDMTKSVINGMDLENMTFEQDALDQLKAWEDKSSNILGSPSTAPAKFRVEPEAENASEFADLLDQSAGQQEKRK